MGKSLEGRFWSKVDKTGECWEWTAYRNINGYGCFGVGPKTYLAHRVVWEFTYGEIPDGLNVLHHCDNPSCVNPDHLYVGDHYDNMQDMARRDRRNMKGERHPRAKTTEEDVIAMREEYARGGITQQELGAKFDISRPNVGKIINRDLWSHI